MTSRSAATSASFSASFVRSSSASMGAAALSLILDAWTRDAHVMAHAIRILGTFLQCTVVVSPAKIASNAASLTLTLASPASGRGTSNNPRSSRL